MSAEDKKPPFLAPYCDAVLVVLAGALGCAAILLFVVNLRLWARIEDLRAEAVVRGYAERVVDPYGNTEWTWVESTTPEVQDENE